MEILHGLSVERKLTMKIIIMGKVIGYFYRGLLI